MLEAGQFEAREVAEVLGLDVLNMSEGAPDSEVLQPGQRPHQVDQHARLIDCQEERLEVEDSLGERIVLGYPPEELLQEAVLGVLQALQVITVNHQIESSVISNGRVFYRNSFDG